LKVEMRKRSFAAGGQIFADGIIAVKVIYDE
jgi:hypothetical protein